MAVQPLPGAAALIRQGVNDAVPAAARLAAARRLIVALLQAVSVCCQQFRCRACGEDMSAWRWWHFSRCLAD